MSETLLYLIHIDLLINCKGSRRVPRHKKTDHHIIGFPFFTLKVINVWFFDTSICVF